MASVRARAQLHYLHAGTEEDFLMSLPVCPGIREYGQDKLNPNRYYYYDYYFPSRNRFAADVWD